MTDSKYFRDPDALVALSDDAYRITQQCGTEPPFRNAFWDKKDPGIYVDVVSGEPLFASTDKYDSGSGWPSFVRPLQADHIVEKRDDSHGMVRTEVRSRHGDSHLGHVFEDGPRHQGGLRYCINSAALRFIPAAELADHGYGEYAYLFAGSDAVPVMTAQGAEDVAILAGGCFWGMQDLLRKQPGVIRTQVGYIGGDADTARYEDVKTGTTGHAEAIEVVFDPRRTSYRSLLEFFFQIHDPTTLNRQGNDVGTQYRSAIFVRTDEQAKVVAAVIDAIAASRRWPGDIRTEVVRAQPFYPAEKYHQDYLEKNPGGYTCHWVRPNWVVDHTGEDAA